MLKVMDSKNIYILTLCETYVDLTLHEIYVDLTYCKTSLDLA